MINKHGHYQSYTSTTTTTTDTDNDIINSDKSYEDRKSLIVSPSSLINYYSTTIIKWSNNNNNSNNKNDSNNYHHQYEYDQNINNSTRITATTTTTSEITNNTAIRINNTTTTTTTSTIAERFWNTILDSFVPITTTTTTTTPTPATTTTISSSLFVPSSIFYHNQLDGRENFQLSELSSGTGTTTVPVTIGSFPSSTTLASTNNETNFDNNDNFVDLETIIGPVHDSYSIVILMTIVYLSILITGVIGNSLTCLVIAKKRYMHTATNYYLFSLAVSDLLLLILGLPHDLVLLWKKYPYVFGEAFCLIRGLSSELSTNASILTIIAFTIERYIAICHPLKSHTTLKLRRVVKTIIFIWIISALCAIPISYQFGIVYVLDENQRPYSGSDHCAVKSLLFSYIFEIATMVFFVIPICIITILYILIGIKLRASSKSVHYHQQPKYHYHHHPPPPPPHPLQQSKPMIEHAPQQQPHYRKQSSSSSLMNNPSLNRSRSFIKRATSIKQSSSFSSTNAMHQQQQRNLSIVTTTTGGSGSFYGSSGNQNLSLSVRRQNASRRAVIKMLVAVVISFFFCYSPFHAQRVMAIFMARNNVSDENFIQIFTVLTHVSGITYYLSSTINPILYQIMSKKFQLALRETLPCFKKPSTGSSRAATTTITRRNLSNSAIGPVSMHHHHHHHNQHQTTNFSNNNTNKRNQLLQQQQQNNRIEDDEEDEEKNFDLDMAFTTTSGTTPSPHPPLSSSSPPSSPSAIATNIK